MAQTVREWTNDTTTPLRSFAVCSDTQVGKRRVAKDDVAEISSLDLAFPATTDAGVLAAGVADPAPGKMTVVFATYQSIQTVSDAQLKHGMGRFDLIICDEAHRTTGAALDGQEESNFIRIHRDEVIGGDKRIYMTATPRIYGDGAKSKANDIGVTLRSMDNEEDFGPTLFYRGFGWAVQEGLLTDYKVIVLTMDEGLVARSLQKRIEDPTSGLILDDATRILGCYKALTKMDIQSDLVADTQPMRRALVSDAALHDSQAVDHLLMRGNTGAGVWADAAYRSQEMEARLRARGLKSRIHRKGKRGKLLSEQAKASNRTKSRVRVRVEHVFGAQMNDMGGTLVRTIGLVRAKAKIGMKNLAYNMRRLVQLRRLDPCPA